LVGQGKQTSAERRKERQAAARAAAAQRVRKVRLQVIGAVVAVALVGAGVAGAVVAIRGGSSTSATPPDTSLNSPAPTPNQAGAPPGKANCLYVANPKAQTGPKKPAPPPSVADATTPYYATIVTDHGTIQLELDSKAAPCTVNSFVSLANQGFFDNTPCHRLLNESQPPLSYAILQCGDPTGTGQGGPGYKFADENLATARYEKGVVAMANAGPNTNGSQFFMMFKDSSFDPNYTPFGRILAGVDVLEAIAKGGTDPNPQNPDVSDVPKTKTTIEKITVSTTPPKGVSTASPKATATPKATGAATGRASAGATAKPTP